MNFGTITNPKKKIRRFLEKKKFNLVLLVLPVESAPCQTVRDRVASGTFRNARLIAISVDVDILSQHSPEALIHFQKVTLAGTLQALQQQQTLSILAKNFCDIPSTTTKICSRYRHLIG
jgi:hypothetical protein